MKTIAAMLIKKDGQWFLTPINAFERIISKQDITHSKIPEQYLYKERHIHWIHSTNAMNADNISGIIILINLNINGETKTIAINADTPPIIIELNEDNITWHDPLHATVQIYLEEKRYTAQIIDENTFVD